MDDQAIATSASPAEARAIAKEAVIYGFPLVDSYRIQYSYFVERDGREYKAPWNTIVNNARVYTPDNKAIQTPNSDTPYSYVGADLRTEPLVLSVPDIEPGRYYSLQFIDMYTFNFAYVGSRATGNGAGNFLLAGPAWQGETPAGITSVIRSETEFAFVLYRTQLFSPSDIGSVKEIQAGYKVQSLSQFLGVPPPSQSPVSFIAPLTPASERTSLEFFRILNFILGFCPTNPSESDLMERFARIGVGAGKPFEPAAVSAEMRAALSDGMADAWKEAANYKTTQIDTHKISSADGFGTRAFMNGRYTDRMTAAMLGIYGNSKEEAIYPAYFVDATGKALSGDTPYRLRFAPDALPPVNAFWSLTLYELPSSLLFANSLDRYLINSPMLPQLQRDPDGAITLYVQNESPGGDLETNWLPAPGGPFFMVLRLYWPKPEALDGRWTAPPLHTA